MAKKSEKRLDTMKKIMDALKSPDIYGVINYRKQSEDKIKTYMHQPLLDTVRKLYEDRGLTNGTAVQRAKDSLVWESNVAQTLHQTKMFGVWHRPDFTIDIDGIRIALEIKKGNNGSSIREGIGQSVVYSHDYDFVVYLFVDISPDKRMVKSLGEELESKIIADLWNNHNVMFDIV